MSLLLALILNKHLLLIRWSMKINDLLSVVLLAQLKKCCTGITEFNGSTPIHAWYFQALSFCCIYDCDDLLASFIWFFTCQFLYALIFPYIHYFKIILSSFPTQWHAFSWLVSSIIIIIISITIKWKSAVLVSMKPWVQLPYKPEFSNFLFTTAKVVSITTVILFHFKWSWLRGINCG